MNQRFAARARLSIRHGPALILALLAIALPACGPPKSDSEESNADVRVLKSLVGNLVDYSDDLSTLSEKFSKKCPPSQALLAKVRQYSLSLVEPVEVNGDAATFRVRVRQGQQERGEVKWTAVKEAGGWKLKTTPLP
jgi:hypothetical protein